MKNDIIKKFPRQKKVNEVRKRLSKRSILGSSILPSNATTIEIVKYKTCEMIIRYRHSSEIKQKELAKILNIDEPRMSELLHYKIENFTLERLIGYVLILYPRLKINLKAA
ncbi:MAG: XRE family transcriptional regulator [Oligoflexia bacterium]|nr:XRE family transcriptional regulator [Oligoflexia bacterium]